MATSRRWRGIGAFLALFALLAGGAAYWAWDRWQDFQHEPLAGVDAGDGYVVERGDSFARVLQKIRDGKVAAAGALIGQVMKEMKGQADAGRARELILASLGVDG